MGWANNNESVLQDCDLKDEKLLVKGFMDLKIGGCEGLSKWFVDDFSEQFNNPTSLKKLKISDCEGIEWIMRSEDGQLLSSLEEIHLWWLDDLKGVVGVMERERRGLRIGAAVAKPPVFSSLKSLSIYECKKMRKLGLPVSALPNLEELIIYRCEEVEEIFKEEEDEGRDSIATLHKLRELKLEELPRVRKVGLPASRGVPNLEKIEIKSCGEIKEIFEDEEGEDEGIAATDSILPKLRVLRLEDLPRLKRVSKATIISNTIWIINIDNCPELMNRLPLGFDDQAAPPPSLKKIRVEREWWESLEWDNPLLPQLLHPSLDFPAGS